MGGRISLGLYWKVVAMNWLGSNRQRIMGNGEGFFTTTEYLQKRNMVAVTVPYKINHLMEN